MLDTPRLRFDQMIEETFKANENSKDWVNLKELLQDIADKALNAYLLRNSSYMYI
jgi:hypothetical protein